MEPRIDPWKIGRKINIEFVDAGLPKKTYTIEDLSRENLQHISHITSGTASLAMLPAGALSIINELWVSGVTQNIYDGKPIIYGTDGADTLVGHYGLNIINSPAAQQAASDLTEQNGDKSAGLDQLAGAAQERSEDAANRLAKALGGILHARRL